MVKNKKKVSVSLVILTLGHEKLIKDELDDISKFNTKDIDLSCFVVDNRDGAEESVLLKNYKSKKVSYSYIKTGKNLGFAGGNNVGISHALNKKSDYILLLNDDMKIPPDLVSKLVYFMEKDVVVGVCSPKIYFAKGYEFHKKRYKKDNLGKVFWYAGGEIDWDNIYSAHRGWIKLTRDNMKKFRKQILPTAHV